jgi:AmmeMemoRadiSam system protein B
MSSIETGFHEKFSEYLTKTNNTICGRHPISVIMAAIECVERKPTHDGVQREKVKFKFVRYEQSNKVREPNDSSVSYASAFAIV